MEHTRIMAALAVAATLLITPGGYAGAGVVSPAGLSRIDGLSAIELVQDKPQSETFKHKMKRVWRNLTGYKFDVACPAFALALSRTTCTETGKNREDARAKCQSRHVLCQVGDTNR
jgi:hypothetical protein